MDKYVVLCFDRYDRDIVSFVLGPYDTLEEAKDAISLTLDVAMASVGTYSIQQCIGINEIPKWAIDE